jgi:hypothetical protein
MTTKKMRLPKDSARGPEPDGIRNDGRDDARFVDGKDVEGHGLPLTPPPSFGSKGPGHGGENIPSPADDDETTDSAIKR